MGRHEIVGPLNSSGGSGIARLDASTHTVVIMPYPHHEIHEGSHFTVTHTVADIGAATTPNDAITLTFTTPNTTKWSHMTAQFEGVGGALCTIREGGSGGASPTGTLTCINNNRNSATTSTLLNMSSVAGSMSYDAGLDTGGTLLFNVYISGASTNQNKTGDTATNRHEWVLKQNTRYQIAQVCTANVAASIILTWYEHTDRS